MKRIKINLDRGQLDSKSIQSQKDFNSLINNHAIMSKPVYKSPWFVGAVGLASIGVIVGSVVVFQDVPEVVPDVLKAQKEQPYEGGEESNALIASTSGSLNSKATNDLVKETLLFQNLKENQTHDKTSTLEENDILKNSSFKKEKIDVEEKLIVEDDPQTFVEQPYVQHKEYSEMDVYPRISGKINGSITKEELLDNKGITTRSDVSVIHFELHLIDGLGGKVYQEKGNQLNSEMKEALDKINAGETIYFENIKGATEKGDVVRLNPLRYVLMN